MSTSVVTESHLRKIRVEIVSGVDLFRVDGTSGEAYFVVSVGKKKGKVKVNRKTTNLFLSPVTNMLMFTDIETDCKTIRIEFHDKERNKVVKKYYCEIAISQILPFDTQHTFTNSLELLDNEGIKQGDYYLTPKITVSMYLFQTKDKIYEREVLSKPNPLIEAVKKTDLCLVLYCLEHFKQIINQPDGSTGNTALHYSTFEYHNEHIILTLLKNSHVDIHAENADKNNPFHFFCSNFRNPNCADVFELFLRRGICINAVNKQNECPLHRAIGNNSIRMLLVELLLKNGADVNAKTDKGQTALHYAVFMRRVDLLSTLLVYGADLNIANKVGDTPLSWCEKKLQNTNFLTTFRHILELMEYLNSINAEQKSIRILVKNKLFIWKLKSLTPRALAGLGILENVEQMKLVKNFKTLTVTDQSSHGDSARASNASASLTASTGDDSEHILTWVHKKEKCEYTSEICKTTKCSVFTLLLEGDENTYAAKAFDNATLPTAVFNSNSKIFQHLKHDNLVSVIGVVEEENALLLEYSSLGNLAGILDSQQLRWTDVFLFALQLISGLKFLHTAGVLHRNLKDSNCLIFHAKNHLKFDDGTHVTVKLGSYGLHELGIDDSKIIKEAGVFLAPEVAGNGTYSEKSDVYSFGLLLWQLVYKCIFGHYSRPFDEFPQFATDAQKIAQIKLNLRPTIPQSTPPRMATLLRQCVLKEPESRPLCVEIERILVECEREYYSNRSLWDATIQDTDG